MIADTQSPAFHQANFPRNFDLYNHTATLAVFGGLVWSYKHLDEVQLQIFSERTQRQSEDPFSSQLPREVARRAGNKRRFRGGGCPAVMLPVAPVVVVDGDPANAEPSLREHCELIQLTDLLTSGVRQALTAAATRRVKLQLASLVGDYAVDTQLPPWLQREDLHRRFSVSCFPDAHGGFYDVEFAIHHAGQLSLFDNDESYD